MTSDWFTDVDFDESSYDEHFQHVHNPERGYNYLQYLKDNLETITDDDLHAYAQIDLFRATMQYNEEFLIYFLSYINIEDNFVEDLIRNQVRNFCKHYTGNDPNGYFDNASFTFNDRIKAVFGYDEILAAEDPTSHFDTDDLSSTKIEAYVTESVENIRYQLNTICRYYLDFIDMYNATKHGNRFQFSSSPEFVIDENHIYQSDQTFAIFLCKRSGEASAGRPYLSNYPLDRLVERSLRTADLTNTLFSYMNTVVEDRLDDSASRTKRFFLNEDTEDTEDATESDEIEDESIIEIWNNDSKTTLPQTEELAELVTDPVSEIAVRLSIDNDTIHLKTAGDSEPSDDYPIVGTISYQTQPGPRLNINYTASFDFDFLNMDIRQYHEVLTYNEKAANGELNRMAVKFEDTGVEVTESIDGVEPLNISGSIDRDVIEHLALAQKITQTRLPLPPIFLEEQVETISGVIENNPERDDVIDAIEAARDMGEGVEYTQIVAEGADKDRTLECLNLSQGFIQFDCASEDTGVPNSLRDCFEDSDIDGEPSFIELSDISGTYDQFLEDVRRSGIEATQFQQQSEDANNPENTFSIKADIEYKSQTFWYDLHRIIIRRTD